MVRRDCGGGDRYPVEGRQVRGSGADIDAILEECTEDRGEVGGDDAVEMRQDAARRLGRRGGGRGVGTDRTRVDPPVVRSE